MPYERLLPSSRNGFPNTASSQMHTAIHGSLHFGTEPGATERPIGLCASAVGVEGTLVVMNIALRFKGLHCAHTGAFDVSFGNWSKAQAHLDDVLTACLAGGVGECDMLAPNSAYNDRIGDRRTAVCDYLVAMSLLGQACDQLHLTALLDMAKSAVGSMSSGLRWVLNSAMALQQVAPIRSA